MPKKLLGITALFFTVVFCAAFIGNDSVQKSDGGPPYNTNAPGEKTCSGSEGANSCHSGGIPDNSGPGTPSILFSGGTTYVPGQTYTVNPKIYHPTRNRFGFQIISIRDNNGAFAGTVTLLDTSKTRMQIPTWGSYQDRNFVMHRLAGSYPTIANTGSWTYQWKAPSTNVGNISFYACFNAVNNNNTNDGGDETYYTKITLTPSTVGISTIENNVTFSAYPNPANEQLTIEFTNENTGSISISLVDIQGKIVRKIQASVTKEIMDVHELANGSYSLVITDNDHTILFVKKVIIQHL